MALAGCMEGTGGAQSDGVTPTRSVRLVERDIEAPDVFSASESGLWDGRPSLGGVWVAHPDVKDPERVIIRNETNGKFVIGALFRRERATPGPRLQVSSDAAAALGMLAGQPSALNVTALRREEVDSTEAAPAIDNAPAVDTAPLDPIQSAAAAIDAAAPAETPPATATAARSTLDKPYIQIGIFSIKGNANGAAKQMRGKGLSAVVKEQSLHGKTFWRVLVGPAATKSERSDALNTIRGTGFSDAYAVRN